MIGIATVAISCGYSNPGEEPTEQAPNKTGQDEILAGCHTLSSHPFRRMIVVMRSVPALSLLILIQTFPRADSQAPGKTK